MPIYDGLISRAAYESAWATKIARKPVVAEWISRRWFHPNGIRSCLAPMYDPAIWLAGMRLRGNSEQIEMVLVARQRQRRWHRRRYAYIRTLKMSPKSSRIFSALENESNAIMWFNQYNFCSRIYLVKYRFLYKFAFAMYKFIISKWYRVLLKLQFFNLM